MQLNSRPVGSMSAVAALPKELQFVSDSQDVDVVKDAIRGRGVDDSLELYDAFFVHVADGDYSEVWGICGIVPYNSKLTTRLL